MGVGVAFLSLCFFNMKANIKELKGRLSYREKSMWTISYFQDSGNNKSLSEFSGKKRHFSA